MTEFDWAPFASSNADFVKFEEVGTEIVGTVDGIRTHTFDPKKGPVVLLDIAPKAGGETVTLAVDKVDLRAKLAEIRPQVSDSLAVKYTGSEQTPNGPKKMFAVRHRAGERPPPPPPPEDEFSDEPF